MKKQIISVLILLAALVLANPLLVKAEDQVCTTVYGGGVVCGAQAPEHEPIETGIEDYPGIFAAVSLFASSGLYMISKKITEKRESGVIYQSS